MTTDANDDYTATVAAGDTTADVDESTLPAGSAQTAGTDPTTVTVHAGSNTDIGDDGYQEQADVAIDKDDFGATAIAGEIFSYRLIVSNNGPADATGVVVEDTLPIGMSFNSATGATCTSTSNGFQCDPFDILFGGPAVVIDITVEVDTSVETGTLENSVSVSGDVVDPNPDNNSDKEPTPVDEVADLNVVKDFTGG